MADVRPRDRWRSVELRQSVHVHKLALTPEGVQEWQWCETGSLARFTLHCEVAPPHRQAVVQERVEHHCRRPTEARRDRQSGAEHGVHDDDVRVLSCDDPDEFLAHQAGTRVPEDGRERVRRVPVKGRIRLGELGRLHARSLDPPDHVGPAEKVDRVAPLVQCPGDAEARRQVSAPVPACP